MYDPAIHLSDAEARVQYGKDVDVQAAVERPALYGTASVYVCGADEFHTLRRIVVTREYTIFFRTVEKNARLVCLCYSVLYVSFALRCCVRQRTFRFEKRRVENGKFMQ